MLFNIINNETTQLKKLLKEYKLNQSTNVLSLLMELFPKIQLFYSNFEFEKGPDNFPYNNLYLKRDKLHQNKTTLKIMADKALREGFGITINKSNNNVDWIFSLGDFISLSRMGLLIGGTGHVGLQKNRIEKDVLVKVGPPNEDIIPFIVRKHLREYMEMTLKILHPKFYLMFNPKDIPPWTIFFNFSQGDIGTEDEYNRAMFSLKWFFPRTVYTGTLENDKNIFYDI